MLLDTAFHSRTNRIPTELVYRPYDIEIHNVPHTNLPFHIASYSNRMLLREDPNNRMTKHERKQSPQLEPDKKQYGYWRGC